MKYIRTKDGRIFEHDIFFDSDYYYSFGDEEILKQADTIDELCDEFVGIDLDNYHFHFTELERVEDSYKYLNEEYKTFYGAIWTDKGLVYVAKLNDKGELELL